MQENIITFKLNLCKLFSYGFTGLCLIILHEKGFNWHKAPSFHALQ